MADGFRSLADVIRRVEDHDGRIEALEKNDVRQDRELAGLNADIALLSNIAHRATTRSKRAAKRAAAKSARNKHTAR